MLNWRDALRSAFVNRSFRCLKIEDAKVDQFDDGDAGIEERIRSGRAIFGDTSPVRNKRCADRRIGVRVSVGA